MYVCMYVSTFARTYVCVATPLTHRRRHGQPGEGQAHEWCHAAIQEPPHGNVHMYVRTYCVYVRVHVCTYVSMYVCVATPLTHRRRHGQAGEGQAHVWRHAAIQEPPTRHRPDGDQRKGPAQAGQRSCGCVCVCVCVEGGIYGACMCACVWRRVCVHIGVSCMCVYEHMGVSPLCACTNGCVIHVCMCACCT
jgi:hypothetical protein